MALLRFFLLFCLWSSLLLTDKLLAQTQALSPAPVAQPTQVAEPAELAAPKNSAAPIATANSTTPQASTDATAPTYFICQMQAKVLPNKVHAFIMPELGTISQVVTHTDKLPKDALVGMINASQLAREAEEMELQLEQDRLTQKNTILQLVRQQEEIEFLLSLSKDERKYLGKETVDIDKRALQNLKERIALLEAQLELKVRKTRADFSKKKENFELRMPFEGKIQYHFPLPVSSDEELRFPPSTLLATVADDSCYYVGLNMVNPELIKLDAQALTLLLNLGSGESLTADYSHKRVEKTHQGESLVYYFGLRKEEFERAHELLGANCIARLFYKTDKPLLYKHKMELVAQNPTKVYTTWEEWVKDNIPDHKILFVGETHLALEPLESVKKIKPIESPPKTLPTPEPSASPDKLAPAPTAEKSDL